MAMASSSRLKPGEKGTIDAAMDTAGRQGPIVKAIQVISNDPANPHLTLILRAQARRTAFKISNSPEHR